MAERRSFFRANKKDDLILASAMRVDLSNRKAVRAVLSYRQEWQKQAIDDMRAIGELQYGVSILSSLVSRILLFAAKNPDQLDSEPVRLKGSNSAEKTVMDTIDRLGSTVSRSDLQFDLAYNLLVTGECYLIAIGPRNADDEERWEIRSINEVEPSGTSVKIYDFVTDQRIVLDTVKGDTFIRIWRPDPFEHHKAISHLRSVLGAAEELLWWDAAATAIAKNRLALAGMIGVPSNLETAAESEEDAKLSGAQRFINRFLRTVVRAIETPTDAAAAVPVLYSYPDNEQKKSGIEVTEFKRPQDQLLEKRTERSLTRIEQGINLPAGVISGLGHATHWGAGQIEESVFRDHVEPLIMLVCSALTRSFLTPILTDSNIGNPAQYFIWYDASNLVIHQDRSANTIKAFEYGAVSYAALRREIALSEHDAPSPTEKEQILEWLSAVRGGPGGGNKEPAVETPGQPAETPSNPTKPPTENTPGQRTSEKTTTPAMNGKGQSPIKAAVGEDADLTMARLQTLCDERCRRALEIAGNRLKNRANKVASYKSAIRNVPTHQVAATLGREAVTKLGIDDLFDDAFTGLHARVESVLPTYMIAPDMVKPMSGLISALRLQCAHNLFNPPGPAPVVDEATIEEFLLSCAQSLAISARTA